MLKTVNYSDLASGDPSPLYPLTVFNRNSEKSSPSPLPSPRPKSPGPRPRTQTTAKKSLATARFASQSSNQTKRRSYGARPRVGTIFIRSVLSNGRGVRKGRRFDVYTVVRPGKEMRTRSGTPR